MKARLSKVVSLVSVLVVLGMSFTRRASAHVEPEGPPPGGGVTVVPPPRATTEEGAHEEEWEDQDHVRVGALLGLGFPRPFSLEALVKIERTLGLGAEVGFMPSLKVGPLEGSFWGVAGDLRVFPFQGAFFIGLRAGYQRMHARATAELPILGPLTETATAETYFVNPRVGFLWTLRSGLTVGLDAGVQVPLKKSYVESLPDGTPTEVRSAAEDVAKTFGYATVPTVDLLRIGFLF